MESDFASELETSNKILKRMQLNKRENYHLVTDCSEESRLAIKYFAQQGMLPKIHRWSNEELTEGFSHVTRLVNAHLFANSNFLNETDMPFLVVDEGINRWGYRSFSGVKSFLRKKMSGLDNAKFNGYHSPFWRVPCQDAFYPKVTCFDEKQENVFRGDIKEAPYDFSALNFHDFKSWHEVSCWKIGNLEELIKKQDNKGIIKDLKTQTIIFPDEIQPLRDGKIIPFTDSRCMYQITFEAYFRDQENVFGIYADMAD